MKPLICILILAAFVINGCSKQTETLNQQQSSIPTQPGIASTASARKDDILKRNFNQVVKPVKGWQKALIKVKNESETMYSEDKLDGSASRLAVYNWDTEQSSVLWEGKDKIFSINVESGDSCVDEIHFATFGDEVQKWFAISEGEVREITDQHASQSAQKLWFPDGQRYLYLLETRNKLGDGAGPEKVPAIYDVNKKKITILPFKKSFWGGLQWMEPGETVLAQTGFDDAIGLEILNLKELTEFTILNTDKISDTNFAYNPSRNQVLTATEGKIRLYTDKAELIETRSTLDYAQEKFTTSFYSFSPEGNRLVYAQGNTSGSRILLADADATNQKSLTQDDLQIVHLEWAPSSKRLVVAFQLPNVPEIWLGRIQIAELGAGQLIKYAQ